jgi:hypothetical protein
MTDFLVSTYGHIDSITGQYPYWCWYSTRMQKWVMNVILFGYAPEDNRTLYRRQHTAFAVSDDLYSWQYVPAGAVITGKQGSSDYDADSFYGRSTFENADGSIDVWSMGSNINAGVEGDAGYRIGFMRGVPQRPAIRGVKLYGSNIG